MYAREGWHKNGKYKGRVEYPEGIEMFKDGAIIDPAYNPAVSRGRNHFDVNGEGLETPVEANDMNAVVKYDFACKGEQPINGRFQLIYTSSDLVVIMVLTCCATIACLTS